MWPPSVLIIRLGKRRRAPLPLPVFLVWPILLILQLLGLPLRLLARIWPVDWLRYTEWGVRSLGLMWYARGLKVKLTNPDNVVDLWFL